MNVTFVLSDEQLHAIAERAADILAERSATADEWVRDVDASVSCIGIQLWRIAPAYALGNETAPRPLTLRSVGESPEQIKKHIAALTEFEAKYGEYISAHEEDWTASIAAGAIDAPDDLGSDISTEDFARLTREVKMLATRADRAIKASGVAPLDDSVGLPTQAFDFEVNDGYFSDDGLGVPRELLERIPSQISGLEIKLEEAEAAEEEAAMRLFGEVFEESRDRHHQAQRRREDREGKGVGQQSTEREANSRPWWENPWIVGIGVTVIGGLILAGVIAFVSGA